MYIAYELIITAYRDGKILKMSERDKAVLRKIFTQGQHRYAELLNPHYEEWNDAFNKMHPDRGPVNYGDPNDPYVVYISDLQRRYGTDIMNQEGKPLKDWKYDVGDECQLILVSEKYDNTYIDYDLKPVY